MLINCVINGRVAYDSVVSNLVHLVCVTSLVVMR